MFIQYKCCHSFIFCRVLHLLSNTQHWMRIDALQETSEDAEPTSKNDSPELKEPTSILWAKLEKRKSDIKLSKKNDRKENVDLEMTKYLKMAAHEVQTNPLKWWCL